MNSRFNSIREQDGFRAGVIRALLKFLTDYAVSVDADGIPHGLDGPGEDRIWISYDSHKHRFTISGRWPCSKIDNSTFTPSGLWNPKPDSPSIGVDADKSAEQIAKDIARRFLPAYRQVLKRCQEARDNHDSYIRNSNNLARDIAGILGAKARGNYGNKGPEQRHIYADGIEVETSADSASFKIRSLSAEKARQLAAFLKNIGV